VYVFFSSGALRVGPILSNQDRRLVAYVCSGVEVVKTDLLKARHELAHSAARCKPPAALVTEVKPVVIAAQRGAHLASFLARRAESEMLGEFASGFSGEVVSGVRALNAAVEDVERYFPSASVVNEMIGQVDKVVALFKDFCDVLTEVSAKFDSSQ
jgi:hypothetical protein